mmetsp:Transcript_91203/g.294988  ORF Transcript_91203/g.294988 Transcript_91203/m.294988 type:complete len:318 (-) Transcript_91203:1320-2273(-)
MALLVVRLHAELQGARRRGWAVSASPNGLPQLRELPQEARGVRVPRGQGLQQGAAGVLPGPQLGRAEGLDAQLVLHQPDPLPLGVAQAAHGRCRVLFGHAQGEVGAALQERGPCAEADALVAQLQVEDVVVVAGLPVDEPLLPRVVDELLVLDDADGLQQGRRVLPHEVLQEAARVRLQAAPVLRSREPSLGLGRHPEVRLPQEGGAGLQGGVAQELRGLQDLLRAAHRRRAREAPAALGPQGLHDLPHWICPRCRLVKLVENKPLPPDCLQEWAPPLQSPCSSGWLLAPGLHDVSEQGHPLRPATQQAPLVLKVLV